MPAGRPTDYKPEYCEQVIELARAGNSRAGICLNLQISRATLNNWMNEHKDFLDAVHLSDEFFQAWLETRPISYGFSKEFNSDCWKTLMRHHCKLSHSRLLSLPELRDAKTYQEQATAIKQLVSTGVISADEAAKLSNIVTSQIKIDEATEFTQRLDALENQS